MYHIEKNGLENIQVSKMIKKILFNSNMNYSIFFACFLMVLETVFTTSITMETLFTLETFFTSEKCFHSEKYFQVETCCKNPQNL